ncbi:MAG: hypothetical protein KKH57_04125, partial [Candidatus Omnitrophica bacterium]|nr:hypothetical protein [Candidatus Omnitrophota bacterium]
MFWGIFSGGRGGCYASDLVIQTWLVDSSYHSYSVYAVVWPRGAVLDSSHNSAMLGVYIFRGPFIYSLQILLSFPTI